MTVMFETLGVHYEFFKNRCKHFLLKEMEVEICIWIHVFNVLVVLFV